MHLLPPHHVGEREIPEKVLGAGFFPGGRYWGAVGRRCQATAAGAVSGARRSGAIVYSLPRKQVAEPVSATETEEGAGPLAQAEQPGAEEPGAEEPGAEAPAKAPAAEPAGAPEPASAGDRVAEESRGSAGEGSGDAPGEVAAAALNPDPVFEADPAADLAVDRAAEEDGESTQQTSGPDDDEDVEDDADDTEAKLRGEAGAEAGVEASGEAERGLTGPEARDRAPSASSVDIGAAAREGGPGDESPTLTEMRRLAPLDPGDADKSWGDIVDEQEESFADSTAGGAGPKGGGSLSGRPQVVSVAVAEIRKEPAGPARRVPPPPARVPPPPPPPPRRQGGPGARPGSNGGSLNGSMVAPPPPPPPRRPAPLADDGIPTPAETPARQRGAIAGLSPAVATPGQREQADLSGATRELDFGGDFDFAVTREDIQQSLSQRGPGDREGRGGESREPSLSDLADNTEQEIPALSISPVKRAQGTPLDDSLEAGPAGAPRAGPRWGLAGRAPAGPFAGGRDAPGHGLSEQDVAALEDIEPPTEEEIAQHAEYLGLRPGEDGELLWVAEQSLCAPVPDGWRILEDHLGGVFFVSGDTGEATYRHPLEQDYRALARMMREALRGTVTYNEVTVMAHYLGMEPSKEPLLMWIARQAVLAPLPSGWEERQDPRGPYFFDTVTGSSQRAHPLDSVFRMLLHVERDRLKHSEFSLVRCGGLGSADESRALMKLQGEGGEEYTFDWVSHQRVAAAPLAGAADGRGRLATLLHPQDASPLASPRGEMHSRASSFAGSFVSGTGDFVIEAGGDEGAGSRPPGGRDEAPSRIPMTSRQTGMVPARGRAGGMRSPRGSARKSGTEAREAGWGAWAMGLLGLRS